jgi:hypothetical protein
MLMRLGFALALAVAAVWLLTHRQIVDIANMEPALRALGIWLLLASSQSMPPAQSYSFQVRCLA